MTNTEIASDTTEYMIQWDMGTYGPYPNMESAKAFQQKHRMTGSVIVPA